MPLLRWLIPLFTILVLLGRSVTGFAAAGPQRDLSCCCPDPDTCKCHHDPGKGDATMKRCSGAEHEVSPELAEIAVPTAPRAIELPRVGHVIEHALSTLSTDHTIEPEKPPF